MKKIFQKTAIAFVLGVSIWFLICAIETIQKNEEMFNLLHGK